MAANLETLRFVLFGDDRASSAFSQFARRVDETTKAVDKNNLGLAESRAKLDLIAAKADEIGKLNPDVKVQIDDYAAKLKLAVLKNELRDIGSGPSVGGKGGLLGGLLGSAGSAGGAGASGLLGVTATLPVIGEVGVPAMVALGAAAVIAGAALAPVAAALIPITAGFGILAAAAVPEVTKVFDALSKKGKDLKKALADLSPAERGLVQDGRGLKQQFADLSKAVQPEIIKAFGYALKIVKDLMPALKPLVKAAGKALDEFLKQLVDWLESPQGQSFIHWLKTVGPQDIKNFGRVLWDVAKGIGTALYYIYKAGSWIDRFLTHWGDDWQLVKLGAERIWDSIVIGALRTVLDILKPFEKIPFIGDRFKAAAEAVHRQLAAMVLDNAQATRRIQGYLDDLHGKKVSIQFTTAFVASHGVPVAPGGAKGMFISQGRPGIDDQLIRVQRGELVVPTNLVRSGAVDHLRGQIPGFAAGGLVGDFTDLFRPSVAADIRLLGAMVNAAENRASGYVQAHPLKYWKFGGFGGVGGGPGGPVEAVARALFPWAASQWPPFNYVEMREAGYNLNARNPTSGAFGVAQFINGPAEYFQWGGNPFTAAGQFTAMFNYIRSRYGTPAAAAQHEAAFNWYDQGGWLPPGISIAGNGTGRPERVGGGDIVINLNVQVGHGTNPRQAAKEIADILNQGATAGVRLRKSILSANG